MNYNIDEKGYYGPFGGAFIPEILQTNVRELKACFRLQKQDPAFNAELNELLQYYVGRPTPLYAARALSDRYRCRIFLKREDLNHTGSHKINNAIGQALLAKKMYKSHIIAETGAGQHGVATATACALLGTECTVFMGAVDVARQKPNVERMRLLGARVIPVTCGSATLKDAANEAIRYWISNPHVHYIIGSVIGPDPYPEMVAYFQSVIGNETAEQLRVQTGKSLPDYAIACIGGGSNAAGLFQPFLNDASVRMIAVEAAGKGLHTPHTAATIAKGSPGIIHGSKTFLLQDDDGQITEPYSISAGLDYPGIGPMHAWLHTSGRVHFTAATDDEAMTAAFQLMRQEGIVPAIESAHALALLDKMSFGKQDKVVICLSGRGDKDMEAYQQYMAKEHSLASNIYAVTD